VKAVGSARTQMHVEERWPADVLTNCINMFNPPYRVENPGSSGVVNLTKCHTIFIIARKVLLYDIRITVRTTL
jgi:hypothetical protein